jgi:hypothetical protein
MVRKKSGLSIESELIEAIDAYAKRLEGRTPGLKVSRNDAASIILRRGLLAIESDESAASHEMTSVPRSRKRRKRADD